MRSRRFWIVLAIFMGFFVFLTLVRLELADMKDAHLDKYSVLWSAVEAFATALGFFLLSLQVNMEKKIEKARFIIDINQSYIDDSSHQELIESLNMNEDLDASIDSETRHKAVQHLDFFEPFYLLIKDQIIKVEDIDDLFGYRFFRVVNDVRIQNDIIGQDHTSYFNIINLHRRWRAYRLKKNKRIPNIETDLSLQKWYSEE